MRRFFVKNLLFIIAVNLLIKPLWVLLIDRTVQNRVGHISYGTYQAIFNFTVIFQILLDFGFANYNSRIISQSPEKIKTFFPSMLTARLMFTVGYCAVIYLAGLALGYTLEAPLLLTGLFVIQILNSFLQFIRSNVAALHKFRADGILSIADKSLMIIICGFLLFSPATAQYFRIEWFVLAQIVSYVLAILLGFFILYKIAHVRFSISLDLKAVGKIIKDCLPYALLIFLMSIYTRSDTTLVERLLPDHPEQAGIYAAAYRLLDVSNMFGLMFAGVLLPMFGRMLAQKTSVQPIVKLSVNLLLPVALAIAVAAAYYGNDIMHLLYVEAGENDGRVFAWLMASFPAFCMMYVYSTLLTANGSIGLLNRIAFAGVVINITLNLILIPKYMAQGAAITTFTTQTVLAFGFIFFAKKIVGLPLNIKWVVAQLLYLVAIVIAGYYLRKLNVNWVLQLVAFGAVCSVFIFIFRFISLRSLKAFLDKKA